MRSKRTSNFLIAMLIAMSSGVARADDPSLVRSAIYPYPVGGAQIGQGWNSREERTTSASCVEVTAIPLEHYTFASSVEELRSSFSLLKKITSSASAAYSDGSISASGSFSTAKQLKINTDSQNFLFTFESALGSTFAVASSTVPTPAGTSPYVSDLLAKIDSDAAEENIVESELNRPVRMAGGKIELAKFASDLLEKPDHSEFYQTCGDGFVSAIHRGSKIYLVLTQRYASRESRESLSASISASGYGASGSGSFSQSTEQLSTTQNLSYRILQEGGIPIAPVPLSEAKENNLFAISKILPKPENLVANPTAFQVGVIPYVALDPRAANLNQPTNLSLLSDYYLALSDLYSLVYDVIIAEQSGANAALPKADKDAKAIPPGPYDPAMVQVYGGIPALMKLRDEMLADLQLIQRTLRDCYAHPENECSLTSNLKSVKRSATNSVSIMNPSPYTGLQPRLSLYGANIAAEFKAKEKEAAQTISSLSFVSDKGELDPGFFLNFYSYLARIPLPRAAYPSVDFDTISNLTIVGGTEVKIRDGKVEAANNELKRAAYAFRMGPWKEFFCDELKSAPLCIPDIELDEFINKTLPVVDVTDFKIIPKKILKCEKSGISLNCYYLTVY